MKFQFVFAVLAAVILNSAQALACSPPRNPLYVQPGQMVHVLESAEVIQALEALGVNTIEALKLSSEGYVVVGTNGCQVTAILDYEQGTGGMCPRFKGVKVIKSECP